MKSWWLSISPRERRMVLLAGGSLLLAILYWGMWRPFQQSVT
ncbi:MAG: type II secretion system protein GspM, partial [Aeromonadaceae bacterium]